MIDLFEVVSVSKEPEVFVESWIVAELTVEPIPDVPGPYRFVVGFDRAQLTGRVSTQIVEQDFANRRVRTRSGRIYNLIGAPRYDADAWLVWTMQMKAFARKFIDVSGDFFPDYTPEANPAIVDTRHAMLSEALQKPSTSDPRGQSAPSASGGDGYGL